MSSGRHRIFGFPEGQETQETEFRLVLRHETEQTFLVVGHETPFQVIGALVLGIKCTGAQEKRKIKNPIRDHLRSSTFSTFQV